MGLARQKFKGGPLKAMAMKILLLVGMQAVCEHTPSGGSGGMPPEENL